MLTKVGSDQTAILRRLNKIGDEVALSTQRQVHSINRLERKLLGSATQEVLRLPELVERILLQLQPTDVFPLQAHSQFKRVIDSSPAIQRKSWLVPDTTSTTAGVELNPLLFSQSESERTHPKRLNPLEPVIINASVNVSGAWKTLLSLRGNLSREQHANVKYGGSAH